MNRKNSPGATGPNPQTGRLFARELLHWNALQNKRKMPWKGEKNPYKIWLSEIILQQTRVEQGLKYYENFISTFPDIFQLAAAPEEKVFKCWEGLGYYSRCRNLIATARYIASELNGVFPSSYDHILQLKGVGPYTAAAIASFAYNLPHAVLDGNVFRVLSRIYDTDLPVDSTAGKKFFSHLAQSILPPNEAGRYNQAIMDFGALVCKPVPACSACFFQPHCQAFAAGRQELLPVKEKRIKTRTRWFNYFAVHTEAEIAVRQRGTEDIWQELFEFPLIETGQAVETKPLLKQFEQQYGIEVFKQLAQIEATQKLTHQLIHFNLFLLRCAKKTNVPGFNWIKISDLDHYAFPRTLQQFIAGHLK